jgi:hypothetical protein
MNISIDACLQVGNEEDGWRRLPIRNGVLVSPSMKKKQMAFLLKSGAAHPPWRKDLTVFERPPGLSVLAHLRTHDP